MTALPQTPRGAVRAMVLHEFGTPLRAVEVEPQPPGPGAVVADVTHAGVCGTDLHLHKGRMPIPLPIVLGHEAVGRVRELGEGVTTDSTGAPLQVGDPIAWMSNIPCGSCFYCAQEQQPSLCETRLVYGINQGFADSPHVSGGWSEQMYLQPGSTIVKLPTGTSGLDVVSLGCAGPTAMHALNTVAPPVAGDVVVVQGSGPVGLASAMLLKLAGASTIILVGGPASRLETARSMGIADVYIDIFDTTPEERLELVLPMTPEGRGADYVVEATGVPAAVAESIDMSRRGGTCVIVGQYTDNGETAINPHHITRKQLKVLGSWAFSATDFLAYVGALPALTERFRLETLVTSYPLGEANDAIVQMRNGTTLKPVLIPGSRSTTQETS